MSFPTTPIFLGQGGWEALKIHPAMNWMVDYTAIIDSGELFKTGRWTDWCTSDWTFTTADGSKHSGEAAFNTWKQQYAPLVKYTHIPRMAVVWESKNGYEMLGQADLFANLPGGSGQGAVVDSNGAHWEIKVPSAYRFSYVKVDGGFKISAIELHADSAPIVVELLKRGVMSPEQLLK
jgi:hypothetical protein